METVGFRLRQLREKHGLNKVEFGEVAGVSGVAVGKWEAGERSPRDDKLRSIAKHFGVSFEDLRVGTSVDREKKEVIQVRLLNEMGEEVGSRWLDKRNLPLGSSHSLALCSVSGDAMEDLFPEQSMVLVDLTDTHIKDGKIYVLKNKQYILIRKLSYTSVGVRQQTLNPSYQDELLTFQEMERMTVMGRVIASLRIH